MHRTMLLAVFVVAGACSSSAPPASGPAPMLASTRGPAQAAPARHPAAGNQFRIAITIDDLPFVGPLKRGDTRQAATDRMLQALAAHAAPSTAFVVCGRVEAGAGTLHQWLQAGFALGNHSEHHRAIDEMTEEAWELDVSRCKGRLEAITGRPVRWFRYPFLQMGRTVERRNNARAALVRRGQQNAWVSIDTSEWALVDPYVRAVGSHDEALGTAIGEAYVDHVVAAARRYRTLGKRQFGRDIAQVLLLHANALAADYLGTLLEALETEGARFMSLDEALADPIYQLPDEYAGPIGLSFLYRIGSNADEAWTWDAAELQAMRIRFAGAEEPAALSIDSDLLWRPVAEGVWVVTHEGPFSANSLVAEMPDSTLLLADTPPTDDATRRLLRWLHARFGPRAIVAVNSHFHMDAAGGNAAILAAGGTVYASSATVELLRTRGESVRNELAQMFRGTPDGERFAETPVALPNRVFPLSEGITLEFGGEAVRVIHPGPAHSSDNVVVFFPDRRVLFGGCMVIGMDRVGYTGDADLARWPASLRVLEALAAVHVIPGHGERFEADVLDHTRRLLADRQRSGGR